MICAPSPQSSPSGRERRKDTVSFMMLEGFSSGIRLRIISVCEGNEDILLISLLVSKSSISVIMLRTLSLWQRERAG
jgi:hypothetical protein